MSKVSYTNSDSISSSLDQLRYLTQQLRVLGSGVAFQTLLSVFVFIYQQFIRGGKSFGGSVLAISIVLSGCSLIMLIMYDLSRRRADVLFEEISDELEWNVRDSGTKVGSRRPDLNHRVILRGYARSEFLPLTPFPAGITVYFVVNMGMAVLSAFAVHSAVTGLH